MCHQLGYSSITLAIISVISMKHVTQCVIKYSTAHYVYYVYIDAVRITDSSRYGKSYDDIVIFHGCSHLQMIVTAYNCMIPSEDGSQLVTYVNVSGVVCGSAFQPNTRGNTNVYVAVGIVSMLVMIVAVLIGYATVAILS